MKRKKYKIEDGVTQSLLTAFEACSLRCQWILEGWMSPNPKESLFFGSLFHKLLEDHYTLCGPDEILDLEEFLKKEDKLHSGIKTEVKEKCFAMAEALYEPYDEFWGEKDAGKEWVELEPVFGIRALPDLDISEEGGILLRGRMDGVFRLKGKLWLLETKTKAQIDEFGMMDALAVDFQNIFYIAAAEEKFREKIAGVLYNVVRKPSLRQKNGEALVKFAQRMKEDVEARPEHYFKRYEVRYTRRAIEEFKQELQILLLEYADWVKDNFNSTRRNRTGCVGRWNCEFLPACAQGDMTGYVQTRKLFAELD